jgi:hypothetical protein
MSTQINASSLMLFIWHGILVELMFPDAGKHLTSLTQHAKMAIVTLNISSVPVSCKKCPSISVSKE